MRFTLETRIVFFRLVSVQVFNIRRLNHGEVPVVRFDDRDAVDVETHPKTVAQGREDHLEVDVVAEDQPEAEHGLEEDDDVHEVDPGKHEPADARPNAVKEKRGHDDERDEVDDDEDADGLDGRVQVCFEVRQPELGGVSAVHDVRGVGDDAHRHGQGVDGDGDAAVEHVAVPEARCPTTFYVNHFWHKNTEDGRSLFLFRKIVRNNKNNLNPHSTVQCFEQRWACFCHACTAGIPV